MVQVSVDVRSDARRAELAASALATLSELGYARTSVRDIAQNSPFSHGVLHYYFKDKSELIVEAIRLYKIQCIHQYDEMLLIEDGDELLMAFAAQLVRSVIEEGQIHRLWYDVRAQASFDEAFRPVVTEIDGLLQGMVHRLVSRYCELSGQQLKVPEVVLYAVFDGLFQRALLEYFCGNPKAADNLVAGMLDAVPALLG